MIATDTAVLDRDVDAPPGSMPEGLRLYAIGDVHGQMPLLLHMHEAILEDAKKFRGEQLKIVYLGDYIDRGSRSRDVLELLSGKPLPRFERIFLRGNHEHMLLTTYYDDNAAPGWLFNGGEATLRSYGIYPDFGLTAIQCMPDMLAQLRQALPERHLKFIKQLKLWHREGGFLFTHAGIKPGVPLEDQSTQDMMWIREDFLECEEHYPFVVVHGHTPREEPEFMPNRIGIDTGAFSTGRLTALVLEGTSRRLLTVTGRPV
jgi:serine/threonine protein phosphatase 1